MKIDSAFLTVPVMRGFTEISALWEMAQRHKSMICGGYARYCCSQTRYPEIASDVDLFPQSEESSASLVNELKEIGFKVKHENEISITFEPLKEHPDPRWMVTPTVQVIKPVTEGAIVTVGTMEDILNNFDFTVVRAGIISPTEGMVDEDFLQHDREHRLVLKNIHCPVSSALRCIKYSKKGFWLSATESVKLFVDWQERPEEYREKIISLIEKMKNPDGSEPSKEDIEELERLMRVD